MCPRAAELPERSCDRVVIAQRRGGQEIAERFRRRVEEEAELAQLLFVLRLQRFHPLGIFRLEEPIVPGDERVMPRENFAHRFPRSLARGLLENEMPELVDENRLEHIA